MRNAPGTPYSDTIDLRLMGGDEQTLGFAWIGTADESIRAGANVPQRAYDELLVHPEPYASLRARLDGAMFVDLRRLVLTEPVEAID